MKSLPFPKAVLFDFGDTVCKQIEFDPLRGTSVLLKDAKFKMPVSAEMVQERAKELNKKIADKNQGDYAETHIFDFQRALYPDLGISFDLSDLEVSILFWKNSAVFEPTVGIHNFLDILKNKKIITGIVSNMFFTSDVIRLTLDEYKLGDKFDFIITSAEFGFRKPSKLFMDRAVALAGCDPSEIWFAGDKIEFDVQGALNAGMLPLWYNPEKKSNTSGFSCNEITHWDQLSKYFT